MTNAEEKSLQQIRTLISEMRQANETFALGVTKQVEAINAKVEAKHMPIFMERDILSTVQGAITTAIAGSLVGYGSPLSKLVLSVVESRSDTLRSIISSSFDEVIALPEFKASIVTAFSHKVAKSIISNNDGLFDKVSNELKQDAIFKSKMSLAVSNVVEECISSKQS